MQYSGAKEESRTKQSGGSSRPLPRNTSVKCVKKKGTSHRQVAQLPSNFLSRSVLYQVRKTTERT